MFQFRIKRVPHRTGSALHRPCVTDFVICPSTGSQPQQMLRHLKYFKLMKSSYIFIH